jgi:hypothetical protein
MPLSLKELRAVVYKTVGKEAFKELYAWIATQEVSWWGEQRPANFLTWTLLLSLYKDIKGYGYQRILKEVSVPPYKINPKSFQHNTKLVRWLGDRWSRNVFKIGNRVEWEKASEGTHQNKILPRVNLWCDSVDFPKQKYHGCSRKADDWSYKLNRPGRRYMLVRDGAGKIVYINGGYSPKLYDSEFLDAHKSDWEQQFSGSTIVADEHFRRGGEEFKEVTWVTPYKEAPENRRGALTKKERDWNKAITKVRARLECPFGEVKQKWSALSQPWAEDETQLDHLVKLSFAFYTFKKSG